MIGDTASLAIGAALAVSSLAWVVWPLLARDLPSMNNPESSRAPRPANPAVVSDDEIEALIARARAAQKSCPTCGPRPEPDAVFCSECGKSLPGVCKACGAMSTVSNARFCNSCGAAFSSSTT